MTSIDQLNREQLAQKFVDYLNATDEQREQQVKKGHASERKAHGRVRVAKKHRDMWGTVNNRYHGGTGCVFVSCSGHGGVMTSPTIHHTIDPELRHNNPYYYDDCGVYEEDCASSIIAAYYPQRAEKMGFKYSDSNSTREGAAAVVAKWFENELRNLLKRTSQEP